MSRCWRFTAVIASLLLCGVIAKAQPLDLRAPSTGVGTSKPLTPNERSQEVLRRLALPPDPKLEALSGERHKTMVACLQSKALELARSGAKEIPTAACRACDRKVVEAAEASFAANKHRKMEPNLEEEIKFERAFCLDPLGLLTASDAVQLAAKEIVDRIKYDSWGSWHVEAQVQRDGLLSYVLIGIDTKAAFSIEIRCFPVSGSGDSVIRGPYNDSNASVYATYSIDADSPKQVPFASVKNGVVNFPHDHNIWAQLSSAKRTFRISVQSIPAAFDMPGFSQTEADWLRRCVG
jgi:hypothetical protein